MQTITIRTEDGWEEELEVEGSVGAELERWVRAGDWGELESTIWIRARAYDEEGDEIASRLVAIDPEEPPCVEGGEHRWVDERVQGSGGGVVISDHCARCGCGRTVDTWAHDPATGEQGLESVTYRPGEHADDVLPLPVTLAAEEVDAASEHGLCETGLEAAAYVLLACRGEAERVVARGYSRLGAAQRRRVEQVCDWIERVHGAAPTGHEVRAARLALRIAADGWTEARVAEAVRAALDTAAVGA